MTENLYDLAIIGGGPGGLTLAMYARRKELKVVIFEGKQFGGYMLTTPIIQNYPGFAEVTGEELSRLMAEQALSYKPDVIMEEVVKIHQNDDKTFHIATSLGKEVETKTIAFATGSAYKTLGAPGEKEYTGKGVSYCATCDAPLFKNKTVAVIGGGNTALTSALLLSDIATKVYLIHRREDFKGEEFLVEQIKAKGKTEFLFNSSLVQIKGEKFVKTITVRDVKNPTQTKDLLVDGVFVHVGVAPLTTLATQLGIELNQQGFIKLGEKLETNVPGVFALGDVTGKHLQIVQATADGALVAGSVFEYLTGKKSGADYKH
ncbi:FAD-dependent oxidoreductase [Candidatus Micrarchaeota archaeon]|nr:FAD-dependent oxidoreductase [Candidatus Micrarchaeota archaeon]